MSSDLIRWASPGMRLSVTALALFLAASSAWAQDTSRPSLADFSRLQGQLKTGDEVVVETRDGTPIRGRIVEVSAGEVTLMADNVRRGISSDQVTRVKRRRNGILLGAVIGTGAGIPFGLALRSWAYNEGGSETGALLVPIVAGLGAGIAIDALLVKPRTVFERAPSTRTHLSIEAGPRRAVVHVTVRR